MVSAPQTPVQITPEERYEFNRTAARRDGTGILLIACGALAREIIALIELNGWRHFDVQCLPAIWHNTPEKIPEGVRDKIHAARGHYASIFVLYGDCGTGGLLDKVLAEEGVERLDGPHCYAFFSGNALFEARAADDLRAFFLTDYLARHFETLVWKGLGLDRHPDLLPMVFGHYEKVVYLAQSRDPALAVLAQAAAAKLGLAYEERFTGYGEMATSLAARAVASPPRPAPVAER